MYAYGDRVSGLFDGMFIQRWHCFANGICKYVIRVSSNTSNVTDHLKKKLDISSSLSIKRLRTKNNFKKELSKELVILTSGEAQRYHELYVVSLLVHKFLSFFLVECSEFRTLISMLDTKNQFNTSMHSNRVKKTILEMCLSPSQRISKKRIAAFASSPLPPFHLNVDLWTSHTSHDKYFGIRIFYINNKWECKSELFAVRLFMPDVSLQTTRLSDVLHLLCKRVLAEYGLSLTSIFSSTSDVGSDLKRICTTILPFQWDWCIAHLCNCALVEAFGTTLDSTKSKNPTFRTFLKAVKKIIEHLHESTKMRAKFEDLQLEVNGIRLRLLRDMPHRWLGTIRLLTRFLDMWDLLVAHYAREESEPFPVYMQKKELIEHYSLMKPIEDIIIMAQCSSYTAGIDVFLALCRLRGSVLCWDAPLPIYDPTSTTGLYAERVSKIENPAALCSTTKHTRLLLNKALEKRFYSSYNGRPRSLILEMQVFLHPSFKGFRCSGSWLSNVQSST